MKHLLSAGLVLAATAASAAAYSQTFTRLTFQEGKDTATSGLRLQLHDPDDPTHPTLWQGPLSIAHGSVSCSVNASLIREVFLSSKGELAVVVSVSGSKTNIGFFTTQTCSTRWPPIAAFSSGIVIQRNLLEVLPVCEAAQEKFSCTSASVYRLSGRSSPCRLSAASLALTKQIFGVAFTGNRTIAQLPPSLAPTK